jgi:hypothetical protein
MMLGQELVEMMSVWRVLQNEEIQDRSGLCLTALAGIERYTPANAGRRVHLIERCTVLADEVHVACLLLQWW